MDQMKNEQMMVVIWLEKLQAIYGKARKDGPHPKHIRGVFARHKDVVNKKMSPKLPPRKWDENDFAQQDIEFLDHD